MKTYVFKVLMEPDGEGWHICYPPWSSIGASTWGHSREEALEYIKEVLEMIIEEFDEEGTPLPDYVRDRTIRRNNCLNHRMTKRH